MLQNSLLFIFIQMKLFSCTILLLILRCANVAAQDRNVFLELGGSGGLGSVNFEKKLWDPNGHRSAPNEMNSTTVPYLLTWRLGISATPVDRNNGWVVVFPTMVNFIYGRNAHKLEIGAGVALSVSTKGAFYIKSPLLVGYRFEPNGKRWFMRASYTPIVGWLVDYQWQHWAGISIGYKLQSK